MEPNEKIRWGRALLAGLLIELTLVLLTTPVAILAGMQAFLVVVPMSCFVVSFLFTFWVGRKLKSGFMLHALLVLATATIIYLAMVFGEYGSIGPVLVIYGPFLFFLSHGLKVLGGVVGARHLKT